MRKRTRRKLKVVAVDAAMIFLASQLTVVLHDDACSMAAPDQSGARVEAAVLYEYPEEEKESETSFFVHSRDWDSEDGEILLKIAMAEAEGEGALYFCADECSSWMEENTEYLYTVGNHSFYR